MNQKPEIVIADDQFLIIQSLQTFLLEEFELQVTRVVNNKNGLMQAMSEYPGALLIIDFNHIDFEDLSDMRKTLHLWREQNLLILTNTLSRNELSELNAAGIKTILLKTADREEVLLALKAALSGKKFYSQQVLDLLTETRQEKSGAREQVSLTTSEIEIIRSIADGLTTKQIAAAKHISYHTVMTHRKNIFRKLNVNNASELVMYAIRAGIIDTIEYNI